MAEKKRRSAVDEVLGGASPVSLKMKAQQAAARRAREADGVPEEAGSEEAAPEPPVARKEEPADEPRPARRKQARRSGPRRGAESRSNGKAAPSGKKKQKPAKRIPVTGNEGDVWEGVCRTLSGCVGAKVTFAAASRAIWAMVVDVEDELEHFEAPELEKPAHADAVANADFEDQLKQFLLEVLQKSKRH